MQQDSARRSNRERTEATRGYLLMAAKKLFVEKGYGDTATPEIVAAAGVTRGALYHHFTDKRALFQAVVEQEAAAVAAEIETATPDTRDPREALLTGGLAFFNAMAVPGRTRLLLLDGPAILGRETMDGIDSRHGARTLREGIALAMRSGAMKKLSVEAVTALLSAAFDRAALAIEAGASARDYLKSLEALIDGLMTERQGRD
ncbi:helix-turn-helix domain-containing protein [Mesorhizobium sp. WSM2239]|uniref:Helix-turn-helix domain-containing protein n=2 Tax=unclassified Mesorhizobium TaxID=325217 RepID=A0AAU8DEF9_9HYPH